MSCGEPVVDLRARGLNGPYRFARVPPLHSSPRSWTPGLGLTTNQHECTRMTISSCTKTKSFRSLDVQSRYSTRSVTVLLKSPMKMHSSWSFDYERFHFASPEGFRGRRHKSHRPNHRPRTWTDIELFADHEFARRRDSEFQTPEIGVGTNRVVNLCSFVSIRGWLDGRIKARTFLV